MVEQLKEGWAYVSQFTPVRTILLLFAVVSLMGMPFTVLMPIFAAKVLHGGPHTLGFLMGAVGTGALVAAISLAMRKSVLGLGRVIAHLRRDLWSGPDCVRGESLAVAFAAADADHGIRNDARNGRQQYDYPNHCSRGQTRPGDELLHDGLRRHGAVRQPAGRRSGALGGGADHPDDYGRVLHRRRWMVCDAIAENPRAYSTDLSRSGDSSG